MQAACITGVRWYTERGRYVTASGKLKGYGAQWHRQDGVPLADRPYVPQRGDLIYFEWYKYNRIDHVGIVESVTQTDDGDVFIHTIEGNPRDYDYVKQFTYPLDDPSIRAYGVTRDDVGADLGPGSAGPQVEALQRRLIQAGWASFETSEYYGEKTTAAVTQLQKSLGLEQTGIADYQVQKALGIGADTLGDAVP
jgi:murein L,D-transpeptidase YcbB/YkuD